MTENALFLLPALRRARDLIDRAYAEPLDLDAMAREAGYSRFHFARAFAAAYGETLASGWEPSTSGIHPVSRSSPRAGPAPTVKTVPTQGSCSSS